jgi:hypothetical protein
MSTAFIAYGLLVSLLVGIIGTARLSWPVKLAIAVAVLIGASIGTFLFFWDTIVTLGGPRLWYESTPYRELLLFLAMVLGMAARYLTRAIEERRRKIQEAATKAQTERVPLELDLWEFIYPMLVSVITFGALLHQLDSERLTLANVILSFQTGFFWQTLLSRAEPKTASALPKT